MLVGTTMYLFKKDPGRFTRQLVISAHGGIDRRATPDKPLPFGTLHWYSKHGDPTSDLGLSKFVWGNRSQRVLPSTRKGQLYYDYALSKYQGRHGNPNETYDKIQRILDAIDTNRRTWKEASHENRQRYKMSEPIQFDVLTIRNRFLMRDVTLSAALRALADINEYEHIHCYFCRSFM